MKPLLSLFYNPPSLSLKMGSFVFQTDLHFYIAKNDSKLSTHLKLLANYGKDAKSGWAKDQSSFLTIHIDLS